MRFPAAGFTSLLRAALALHKACTTQDFLFSFLFMISATDVTSVLQAKFNLNCLAASRLYGIRRLCRLFFCVPAAD